MTLPRSVWHFDTLTLWHHVVSLLIVFSKKTSYLVTTSMLFGKISINCHIGVQDICNYLEALASERKILLPMNSRTAYDELTRIGMPTDSPGYEYKTFIKYIKRVWRQDAFTPFFYRSPLCYHRHLFIALLSQRRISEKNREKQRNLEKFREIRRRAFKNW